MKKETLFEAIGNLDLSMIEQTEPNMSKRKKPAWGKIALIAAVIAGLGITAGAAPLIRNTLKNGSMNTHSLTAFTPTNPVNGSSYELQTHDIRVDIELNKNAPISIETYYMPEIPSGYIQYHGAIYNQNSLLHCVWKAEDDYAHDISYWQTARYSYDPDEIVASISTAPGETPVAEMRRFGEIEGYYAQQKPFAEMPGRKLFFWSDGSYLYRLELPYEYSDEQMEQIITTLTQVADISSYLVSNP